MCQLLDSNFHEPDIRIEFWMIKFSIVRYFDTSWMKYDMSVSWLLIVRFEFLHFPTCDSVYRNINVNDLFTVVYTWQIPAQKVNSLTKHDLYFYYPISSRVFQKVFLECYFAINNFLMYFQKIILKYCDCFWLINSTWNL